jgi:asparagine synthase (glutamine-hydrolysing)
MCGIAGVLDFGGQADPELLARMCRAIEHRGPDARGVHVDGPAGLGIQRLAIIDVAGGDQPIFNEDRSVAVVLNGEIYNYLELREDLIARGHRFATSSDTEVLVHLYEEHGDAMVGRLRGMFAFAIWDRRGRRLFLARDRVGKKPLFWTEHGGVLRFASELSSLLQDPRIPRELDPRAVEAYLGLGYVPDPMCVLRGVHKLPPASTLAADDRGQRVERYWSLDYSNKLDIDEHEAAERLRDLIDEATRIRLMSEVPLGAFLSGGIDSSAIVAAMARHTSEPVKTFSIGFGQASYDETRFARAVAEQFSTDHREFRVEPEALSIMPRLARHYGEPFADPSAIPSFYLAELTSRHVTVALNGDGGDESFAGYTRYGRGNLLLRLRGLRPLAAPLTRLPEGPAQRSARTRIRRHASAIAKPPWEAYGMGIMIFEREQRARLLSPAFAAELGEFEAESVLAAPWRTSSARELPDRMLDLDVQTYLAGDLLPKMDIATMAYSLEARSPFLDHVLMEFAAALPARMKLRGTRGKRILKQALRGTLPDEILDRPKMGFGVPLDHWFRHELRDLPAERLLDPAALERGYLRREEIERLIAEHHDGRADHSFRLWSLLQLDSWHREVADAPVEQLDPAAG